jgi:hypothetical protein
MFRHQIVIIRGVVLINTLVHLLKAITWLRLPLSNRPNRVGICHPSPEDGKRSSFRNVVFFCVFRIADDGQSPKTQ